MALCEYALCSFVSLIIPFMHSAIIWLSLSFVIYARFDRLLTASFWNATFPGNIVSIIDLRSINIYSQKFVVSPSLTVTCGKFSGIIVISPE